MIISIIGYDETNRKQYKDLEYIQEEMDRLGIEYEVKI